MRFPFAFNFIRFQNAISHYSPAYFLAIVLFSASYFFTALLGLKLGPVAGIATPIWPPTGISLAVLLIFGCRLWPGIAVGAFLINFWTTHSLIVSLGITLGNTLESLLAAYFLGRAGFNKSLERHQDVIALFGIGVIGSTFISSLIGTTSSWLMGVLPPPDYIAAFRTWWLGDALSNLVVAPLLLIWWSNYTNFKIKSRKGIEEILLYLLLIVIACVMQSDWGGSKLDYYLRPNIFYPILLWATFRHSQRGAVTSTIILSSILTWGTSHGYGPFNSMSLTDNLFALQTFIGTMSITFLFVGAIVNERKQIELWLRGSEKRFRRLAEADIIGVFFWETGGKILSPNNAFLKMIGLSETEFLKNGLNWRSLTPNQFNPNDEIAMQELLATGVCKPYEKAFMHKNGSQIPVLVGGAFFQETKEQGLAFVIDMSEVKKALNDLNLALKNRDEIVGIVSHDLKNPLASIQLNVQLLKRTFGNEKSATSVFQQFEILERTAYTMQKLIENLLDFTKIESGTFVVNPQPEESRAIIADTLEILQPLAQEKSIQLTSAFNKIDHKVLCDKPRVLQVLSNIVGNAIKFTPFQGSIRVYVEENETQIHFLVEDTGPGIPPEQIPHIFNRYWQGKQHDKHSVGLGLSIAKGIVEAHGGQIWAENRKECNGSIFHFTLPMVHSPLLNNFKPSLSLNLNGGSN